jgi:hypothetical protein
MVHVNSVVNFVLRIELTGQRHFRFDCRKYKHDAQASESARNEHTSLRFVLVCSQRKLVLEPEAPAKDARQSAASGPSLALQALMNQDYGVCSSQFQDRCHIMVPAEA